MIKVIACKIYEYYISKLDLSLDNYEIVYLDIQQHNQPHTLAKNIQEEINKSKNYEKIIVLYGLCGNALLEIKAGEVPTYLIRVHDCLSVLLGSKERFVKLFANRLSSSWSCYSLKLNGYDLYNNDKYASWCNEYDKETADYLMSILNNQPSIYLTYDKTDDKPYLENLELINIDLQFLKDILMFKSSEIIRLKQKEKIIVSSDFNQVFELREDK